jgi:hypothetical protein
MGATGVISMPFPFVPGGLLLAMVVLGGTMLLFALVLKALDWSVDAVRRTALAGIVTGLQDWQRTPDSKDRPLRSSSAAAASVEEWAATVDGLERVSPDGTRHRRDR